MAVVSAWMISLLCDFQTLTLCYPSSSSWMCLLLRLNFPNGLMRQSPGDLGGFSGNPSVLEHIGEDRNVNAVRRESARRFALAPVRWEADGDFSLIFSILEEYIYLSYV